MQNDSNPLESHKVNVTIRGCCFGFMTSGNSCVPICQNVCINSHCIGNNQCRCNSGYYPVDSFRCLPTCDDPPCGDNMACLAPNRCVCKPNYKKLADSCEPICSFTADNFECINAKCIAPNVCECHAGYRNVSDFQCEPICSDCANGECTAPDTCECHDGYETNADGICAPICSPLCVNSKCVAPNHCECDANHEKYMKAYECLEKHVIKDRQSCMKSCQRGACSDDGTCICESGYEMYNGLCSKLCDKKCSNGRCLEDQCVCLEGFKLAENSTTNCSPICAFEGGHDCVMGVCVAPQICKCLDGYRFLDARNCTCVPKCDPPCINGVCTEDGCLCRDNFYSINDYECIKNCSEGFKWLYDDCVEEMSGESNEGDVDESLFDDELSTTVISLTSYEDSDEDESTTIMGVGGSFYETSADDTINQTTERS